MCGSMADIQSATAEKIMKKREKIEETTGQKYNGNNTVHCTAAKRRENSNFGFFSLILLGSNKEIVLVRPIFHFLFSFTKLFTDVTKFLRTEQGLGSRPSSRYCARPVISSAQRYSDHLRVSRRMSVVLSAAVVCAE